MRVPLPAPTIFFDSEVPAHFEVTIEVQAESDGPYNALIVDTPEGFEVHMLYIAGQPQWFDTVRPMPAERFAANAGAVTLELAGIAEGVVVGLRIKNLSSAPRPFRARLTSLVRS